MTKTNTIDEKINSFIEETRLSPFTTEKEIQQLAEMTLRNQFAGACTYPIFLPILKKNGVKNAVTVISFPIGHLSLKLTLESLKEAIDLGADEIDFLYPIHSPQKILESVRKETQLPLKVILETAAWTDKDALLNAAKTCIDFQMDYLKTSTGFSQSGGAKTEDIEILKRAISEKKSNTKIKASGGIRDVDFAKQLINLGVSRIGTSSGEKICHA